MSLKEKLPRHNNKFPTGRLRLTVESLLYTQFSRQDLVLHLKAETAEHVCKVPETAASFMCSSVSTQPNLLQQFQAKTIQGPWFTVQKRMFPHSSARRSLWEIIFNFTITLCYSNPGCTCTHSRSRSSDLKNIQSWINLFCEWFCCFSLPLPTSILINNHQLKYLNVYHYYQPAGGMRIEIRLNVNGKEIE